MIAPSHMSYQCAHALTAVARPYFKSVASTTVDCSARRICETQAAVQVPERLLEMTCRAQITRRDNFSSTTRRDDSSIIMYTYKQATPASKKASYDSTIAVRL